MPQFLLGKWKPLEFTCDGVGFTGVLQRSGGDGSEWQQDCLACLLKLLCQLGVSTEDGDILHDVPDNLRNKRARRFRKGSSDKLVIPKLSEVHEEAFISNEKIFNPVLDYFPKGKLALCVCICMHICVRFDF